MATLREIQLTELEMLRYFDKLCREHGLRYSLIGGSMLGAVRHKGFIPWDDDIDTYMSIEDFRKFIKIFKENTDYFLQSPNTDIQSPFVMYKLRKNNTCMMEPGTERLHIHQGIWLDIFVYCNAGKYGFTKKMQRFLLSILQTYRCRYRYCEKGSRRIGHFLLCKFPAWFQLGIDCIIMRLIAWFGCAKSSEIFAIDVAGHFFYPKRYFEEQAEYQFEDLKAMGMKDSDGYLRYVYGDSYMIPKKWNHMGDYSKVQL